MQNNRKQKPIVIINQPFQNKLKRQNRKIYLTFDFLPFGQIKKYKHSTKQPITPYIDWINRHITKRYHGTKFRTKWYLFEEMTCQIKLTKTLHAHSKSILEN